MEQSGVVGLSISGDAQRVTDFRDAPFCTKYVLAQLLGMWQKGDRFIYPTVNHARISRHHKAT
ncbi:hypothetical protein PPSAL_3330 [Ectopseudomonas oleovorans]|jgi:hypothetical protein|uniref:Uncharacterized protein n=1 Tax=Ectopseudomonas oleovorans (strain CECT 5344) TaxID=1182590 RepID=W6QZP6_ECTO5|nr:hypothetical protein BN5_3379 [Pseudomonas oleovorans CECT 5344]CDR92557.1 hypothetical protein PPSAL_3330 [Pseudomonas oleovorans]